MKFNDYQQLARKTAIYPEHVGLEYTVLGLASEAGEVAGKLKKILRDKAGLLSFDDIVDIGSELGDVLWYVAMTADELGLSLLAIAERNISKLADRQERKVLGGSGDER